MGVKCTKHVTRQEAEALYIEKFVKYCQNEERSKLERKLGDIDLSDIDLHWKIERPSDADMREIYIAIRLAFKARKYETEARRRLATYDIDRELENFIENLNDAINGGEGFENYVIVPEGYQD